MVLERPVGGAIQMKGVLAALPPSTTAGLHLHTGFSCADAVAVGLFHYHGALPADPWADNTYASDHRGVHAVDLHMTGFSLEDGSAPVMGRTLVVHDSSQVRSPTLPSLLLPSLTFSYLLWCSTTGRR